ITSGGGALREVGRAGARAVLTLGYVVRLPDSMRGATTTCSPPLPVPHGRRAKDAMDAVAHLAKQSSVDPARIYAVGFSQGTQVAEIVSGSTSAAVLSAPGSPRFAATAGLYGGCGLASRRPAGPPPLPVAP